MSMPSLRRFNTAKPGLKNMPIQTMPWLFTKCRMFSAILKSPYWGNCFSRSQHQQLFMKRTKRARKKSIPSVETIVITLESQKNDERRHELTKYDLIGTYANIASRIHQNYNFNQRTKSMTVSFANSWPYIVSQQRRRSCLRVFRSNLCTGAPTTNEWTRDILYD